MVNGVIAVITGYLLGSIPTAYIAGRLARGEDIRRLGGGNIGGLNTYREVGMAAGVAVVLVDIGKGAAAVAIAYWPLQLSPPWVLATALAAILGHMWMAFLKFSGGKGAGTTIGVLSTLMPLYGYWPGLVIFLTIIAIPVAITRNVALSLGIGLVALPFIFWLGMGSGMMVIWSVVTGLLIALRFSPTAREAIASSRTVREFIFDRWQRKR